MSYDNYGVYNTLARQTVPGSKLDVSLNHGKIRRAYEEFVLAGELSIADTIGMMVLPKGARVVNARFIAPSDGTTGQYDIGWAANGVDAIDADGLFLASVADTGAGAVDAVLDDARPGFNKKFGAETEIVITVAEATTASIGDTLKLIIEYVLE